MATLLHGPSPLRVSHSPEEYSQGFPPGYVPRIPSNRMNNPRRMLPANGEFPHDIHLVAQCLRKQETTVRGHEMDVLVSNESLRSTKRNLDRSVRKLRLYKHNKLLRLLFNLAGQKKKLAQRWMNA